MSAQLWETSTSNAFSTSLNGSISSADTSITLTTVTGLQAPGVLVIDRQDGSGNDTPTKREFITFTGISSDTLTGCSRGVAGSSAQAHASGALIEETMSVTHWGGLVDFIKVSHDSAGHVVTSTATISDARVYTRLNASGASIIGRFPIHPGWVVGGLVSLVTTSVGKPLPMPQAGLFEFFSAVLRSPASGSALIVDINKNGSTLFTDSGTRLTIPAGGTYASTASIGIKTFVAGDILSMDIDQGGGLGADLTVLGRAV
jgi:hypothetical protein